MAEIRDCVITTNIPGANKNTSMAVAAIAAAIQANAQAAIALADALKGPAINSVGVNAASDYEE